MRYMLLICSDDKNAAPRPRAEMEALVQGHRRFSEELQAAGKMVAGERLRPEGDASRVRLKAGHRQVMDGPFAETKEALGGFYLIECDTRDEALEWAKISHWWKGRLPEAASEYRRAMAVVDNPCERAFLVARLSACESQEK